MALKEIDLGNVRGPQGPKGATGAAGPNTVSTSTTTTGFTSGHFLFNNNGRVGAKDITPASIGALAATAKAESAKVADRVAGCGYESSNNTGNIYRFPNGIKLYVEWFTVATNSTRKITLPSGLFTTRVLPPITGAYVTDGDWEAHSIVNQTAVTHWDLSSVTLGNYDSGKAARVILWVIGE